MRETDDIKAPDLMRSEPDWCASMMGDRPVWARKREEPVGRRSARRGGRRQRRRREREEAAAMAADEAAAIAADEAAAIAAADGAFPIGWGRM